MKKILMLFILLNSSLSFSQEYSLWLSGDCCYSYNYSTSMAPYVNDVSIYYYSFIPPTFTSGESLLGTGVFDVSTNTYPINGKYRGYDTPNFNNVICETKGTFQIDKLQTIFIGTEPNQSNLSCNGGLKCFYSYDSPKKIYQWAVILPKYIQPSLPDNQRTLKDKLFISPMNTFTISPVAIPYVKWQYQINDDFYFKDFPADILNNFPMNSTVEKILEQEYITNSEIKNLRIRILLSPPSSTVESPFFPGLYNYSSMPEVTSETFVFEILNPSPKVTTITLQNTTCSDTSDGYATFTFDRDLAAGEYFDFTMYKKDPAGDILVGTNQYIHPSEFINKQFTWDNLGAGTYYLRYQTKLDGGAAIAAAENSLDFTISSPAPVAFTTNPQNVKCTNGNSGSISVAAQGGSGSYQFSKDGGATWQNSATFSGLVAGSYSILVKDSKGCEAIRGAIDIDITEPDEVVSISIEEQKDPIEHDGNQGRIEASASGGTGNLSFAWTNSVGNNLGSGTTISNLAAGSYILTVTDANACTASQTISLANPPVFSVSISSLKEVSCHDGSNAQLKAEVSGGAEPLLYEWEGAFSIEKTLDDISVGTYKVIVTDDNGVMRIASYTVTEPTALSTAYQVTNVLCFGNATGAIDLSISGGTPPYSYLWSNSSTTQDVSNLTSEVYDVICTDANGCTIEGINIAIGQPAAPLQLSAVLITPSGYGLSNGSIDLSVEGGTAPYTYLWNTGTTTQDLTNLKAGDYTVTATDAHGCQATFNSSLSQPDLLETSPIITNPLLCFADTNGSLTTVTKGGVAPYTYSWKKGTTPIASTAQIQNLTTATYSVTVTDKNNNQTTQTVVLGQPDLLTVGFESTPISCNGDTVGSLTALPQGGVLPYSYSWSNGASTAKISNMGTGNYLVSVTDSNGCNTLAKGTVASTSNIKVTPSLQDPSCYTACNGSISLEITGGSGDYSMEWDTAAKGNGLQATNLCAGNYSVTVKDNVNGCVLPMNFTLNQPQQLTVNTGVDQVLCAGQTAVIQSITNQTSLSYVWTSTNGFSASTAQVKLDKAGEYQLEVTNANGCKATDTVRITASDQLLDATFLVSSQTYTNQDIVLINVSNQAGQTYEWLLPAEATSVSEISKSKIIKFSKIGVYTVALKAKNEAGCTTISSKQLVVEEDPKLPDPNPQTSSFIKEFLVYPNPTINNGLFTVKVSLSESAPISLTLYEQSNGSLLNQTELPTSKEHLKEYRMSLSSGIYLIILRTSKGVQSKKIIVN